jgi:enoyl-CoA hydratase/carnithine racemase
MGARVIHAEEALRIGLATRLFAAADLERETLAFAEQLCGLSQFTIRAVKQVIAEIQNGAVAETELTRRLLERQLEHPDYLEGRRAFLEKRAPRFTGR